MKHERWYAWLLAFAVPSRLSHFNQEIIFAERYIIRESDIIAYIKAIYNIAIWITNNRKTGNFYEANFRKANR